MKKRGKRIKQTARGHVLTPKQVENLVMPVHMAIELLPLGLYTEDHAHDLAAFLCIAQTAALTAGRDDIVKAGAEAVDVLLAMKHRAERVKSWNVTTAERETIMESLVNIDRWMRIQTSAAWKAVILKTIQTCDVAANPGKSPLELVEE